MTSIFYVQEQYPGVAVPSVLKAAVIKTFGYLIQHERGASLFTETEYVCNTILEICLSPQVLADTNINVYIRNSWTLSFICNLFPIEAIAQSKFTHMQPAHPTQNLETALDLCTRYAELTASNKEKVAASSIRALGFIAQGLIQLDGKQRKGGQQLLPPDSIRRYVERIIDLIVNKLENQQQSTPKVIWNLCVATSKIIDTFNQVFEISPYQAYQDFEYQGCYLRKMFSFRTTQCFLAIFMDGLNYKTKIHACQTLLKYINIYQYGFLEGQRNPENLLRLFWTHIQSQLKQQINFDKMPTQDLHSHSTQEQIAYIEQIHISFISFWAHVCFLTRINLSSPGSAEDHVLQERHSLEHQSIMVDYFNKNAFDLLQSIILYLRKQLKVPEYKQIFEEDDEFHQEDLQKETDLIFKENPLLLPKLEKMQT